MFKINQFILPHMQRIYKGDVKKKQNGCGYAICTKRTLDGKRKLCYP